MIRKSGVIFIDKAPIFTDAQLAAIAEIIRNLGLILVAGIVVPYVVGLVDKPSATVVVYAVIAAIFSWGVSIILIRDLNFI